MRKVFVFCLLIFSGSLFAEISTSVDRNRLAEGETFNLMLEVQGQVAGQPDTKPLEKDFDVLGTASGSQMTVTNGKVDARTTWTISLQAKHSGKIEIPPLALNGQKTKAITVDISDAPQADANSGEDIFIETEISPDTPYVQAEVRYTVRIHHAVQLDDAELNDPKIDGALVRKVDGEHEYYKTINDRRYRVIELNYVIFPQSSGELVIPEVTLNARVRQRGQRGRSFGGFFDNDSFNRFSSSRSVRFRSKSHTLQVQPQPKKNKGSHWLPAKHLGLTEEWDAPKDKIRVGEPITRTLKLTALGLTAAQLPDLKAPDIDGMNAYPDQPQSNTQDTEGGVRGEKTRRIAFVPTQPGKFKIPAIEIYWWDTQSDKQQRIELPERNFTILPAEGTTPLAKQTEHQSLDNSSKAKEIDKTLSNDETQNYWPWVSLVLTLLWLSTLVFWWRQQKTFSTSRVTEPRPDGQLNLRSAEKAFRLACRANDSKAARDSLLKWARLYWPDNPPFGLGDLAERSEDLEARESLLELNRTLYREGKKEWNGAALEKVLKKLSAKQDASSQVTVLPPLYPEK